MSKYNFDQPIDRRNTACEKWDELDKYFGNPDLLSMWVADMDFRSPEPVIQAFQERVTHGVFGYTIRTEKYQDAIIGWMNRRHQWKVESDWLVYTPGTITALSVIISTFTEPGDKVMIQSPVYPPFFQVVERNGRELVNSPLKLVNGTYTMDFEDIEQKISTGIKLFILCSPQNPVGRVWKKEELQRLGKLCIEHNILLVSDEIHSDLVYQGSKHLPYAAISEEFAMNSIVCTAPSKTFNLPGLNTSTIIIPNPELREQYSKEIERLFLNSSNTFGAIGLEAAYTYGEAWLEELIEYLHGNLDYLNQYLSSHIPGLKIIQPEGTYLVWIDCRELGMDPAKLEAFLNNEVGVAFNQGYTFGTGGEGFIRINIACSRSQLKEALQRLHMGVNHIR